MRDPIAKRKWVCFRSLCTGPENCCNPLTCGPDGDAPDLMAALKDAVGKAKAENAARAKARGDRLDTDCPTPGSRSDFVSGHEPEAVYERARFAGLSDEWARSVAGIPTIGSEDRA